MDPRIFRADLHCHSKFSDAPSTWFHQWVGTGECYTETEDLYRMAKKKGMHFVTLTDHDTIRGALELHEKHPEDTFVSCEVTAFFPGDRARVHVLVWDISESQFLEINHIRQNLYELRDYLLEQRIHHSLAHASFDMDGLLTLNHLEKLVLLFDVFEGRNGGRGRASNEVWVEYLRALTPERISHLFEKHLIVPASADPWIKGITGGSDDHAGLFIGDTWTESYGPTKKEFLAAISAKKTAASGAHSTFTGYAYGVLKIAHEFAGNAKGSYAESVLGQAVHYFFHNTKLSLVGKFKLGRLKKKLAKKETVMGDTFLRFLESMEETHGQAVQEKMDRNYAALGEVADAYLRKIVKALKEDARKGQLVQMMKHLGSIFPHLALITPFLASGFHLHGDRGLLDAVRKSLPASSTANKKVLWFTDTLEDLNGVSETLRKIAAVAREENRSLKLVAPASVKAAGLTNLIRIPVAEEFALPHYEDLKLSLPSLLPALRLILEEEPDRIVISTPGPMGWLGLLAARILKIPVSGVYHTDFSSQARRIVGDETVVRLIESYLRLFYRQMDALWVPTREYMGLLAARGLDQSRMKLFRRGIDTRLFHPDPEAREILKTRFDLDGGITLLYAGRVSQDKNLSLLAGVFKSLTKRWRGLSLIIAGDGPWLSSMKNQLAGESRVRFTGRIQREDLAPLYAGSDLLVFPSATDTFGMVVLEAQASGLPCVVNDMGGPKEIIDDGQTGFVVRGQSQEDWFRALSDIIARHQEDPGVLKKMGEKAREKILRTSRWEDILPDFFNEFPDTNPSTETNDFLKLPQTRIP